MKLTRMTQFYDSVTPANIPAAAYAALYADGAYAAPARDVSRFAGVQWITVTGKTQSAGITAYEPGNPVYSDGGALLAWVVSRVAAGWQPVVYCDRSDLPKAVEALGSSAAHVWWWVPTLDNTPWTAQALVADVGVAEVTTSSLWACQYAGGLSAPYNVSLLYGSWSLALRLIRKETTS